MIYQWPLDARIGKATNLKRLDLGWIAQVHPKAQLSIDYHAGPTNTAPGSPPSGQSRKRRLARSSVHGLAQGQTQSEPGWTPGCRASASR